VRPLWLGALLLVLAAGCTPGKTPDRGDVLIDGVSILGAWHAAEVVGDAEATRDLGNGAREEVLVVRPNGRALLVSVDRRGGERGATYSGLITGNQIEFAEREGVGVLLLSGRRLVLRDADGRSTAFERSEGR
jgi:hypothetical protein